MLTLEEVDVNGADRAALLDFMTSHHFPFHVRSRLSVMDVEEMIDDGDFHDAEHESHWLIHREHVRIGLVRLEDLEDPTPLFDLRLATSWRGQGLGEQALTAITSYVFGRFGEVTRFEGQTREDNVAMRKVFERCGWLKEAHYRESWPVAGAPPVASVAYAILRRDWETGTTTTFEWNDLD